MTRRLAGDISTRMVISAIYALHGRFGRWPTREEIADYLECDPGPVRAALRELKTGRLFRDRQRDGRKVWMPWEQA